MKILGINALNHDACITLLNGNEILFSAHSERYSGIKNDSELNHEMFEDCKRYGDWDKVVWFERPWIKKQRQFRAGQYSEVFQTKNLPSQYLKQFGINKIDHYVSHHLSHASAAYYTSPYDEAVAITIDAIGEWETCTIYHIKNGKFTKMWKEDYPNSLGLFYSAFTQRLGLKPQEDEYIMMGMVGWDKYDTITEDLYNEIERRFFTAVSGTDMRDNLHRGILDWDSEVYPDDGSDKWKFKVASVVQRITEERIMDIFIHARGLVPHCTNFVYGGGVALNCVANSRIANSFPNLWILPNPGDGGSSLGCASNVLGEKINFKNTFLGTEIEGEYPIKPLVKELVKGNIVGVASGRAEFGPRALGNRSLLADPRGNDIKDKVNKIKRRQEFRPFAPAVLIEHADKIFDIPNGVESQYMQFVAKCKYPNKYPAICHVDGTSRIQTVNKKDNPNFYNLIKEFYKKTGCPMLLNTSLNIKGKPIVNDTYDKKEFERKYNIKVY